jgi:hypothetical protein
VSVPSIVIGFSVFGALFVAATGALGAVSVRSVETFGKTFQPRFHLRESL